MRRREDILDELLVLQCQAGEVGAFEMLALRWHPRLLRHAYQALGDPDEAGDAVQEAWVAIVRGLGRIRDPARFRVWAHRVVRNKCADLLRKKQQRRSREESIVGDIEDGQPRLSDDPRADKIHRLRQGLRSLPADRRTLLMMFYFEGMSVSEIAAVLQVPEGTVKSRLYHTRLCLRQAVEEPHDEERRKRHRRSHS